MTWLWSVPILALPIYNMILGVNPILVGYVLSATRLLDAFFDPIMGSITDNCRSKWGRRRPFMLAGAIAAGLTYGAMWAAPKGWSEISYFLYFLATCLLFSISFSVFAVPYYAYGYEMSESPKERTKVMGMRIWGNSLCGLALMPWILPMTKLSIFGGDEVLGAQCVGVGTGLLMMMFALIPALFLVDKTNPGVASQGKVPLWSSLRYTLSCKPYLILVVAFVTALVMYAAVQQVNTYLAQFYVFNGDTQGLWWDGLAKGLQHIVVLVFAPLMAQWAGNWGKKRTCLIFLWGLILGSLLNYFCFQKSIPWLMVVPPFIMMFGWAALWMFVPSMIADVTDWDELQHGTRREGMFGAIHIWIIKVGFAVGALAAGYLIHFSGFDIKLLARQPESTFSVMLLCASLFPAAGAFVAWLLLRRFPLDEAEMVKVKAELQRKRSVAQGTLERVVDPASA
jgi:GPH family glycoside/pentoside/hexuronide:cation symporter